MKYLPVSLYLTGKPLRNPGQWGDGCIVTETFEDPGRIDLIMGSGSQQACRCPGGRYRRRGSADTVDIVPPEAREGTCGGRGAELKYRAIHVCKLRWNYGTSGEWGSEGLVNVMGNTVGTGRR